MLPCKNKNLKPNQTKFQIMTKDEFQERKEKNLSAHPILYNIAWAILHRKSDGTTIPLSKNWREENMGVTAMIFSKQEVYPTLDDFRKIKIYLQPGEGKLIIMEYFSWIPKEKLHEHANLVALLTELEEGEVLIIECVLI